MTTLDALNNFWFGQGSLDDPMYLRIRMRVWFGKEPDFDATISREFQSLLAEPPSVVSDRDRLGRILLFDQVPRNAYRGDGRMFAFDAFALDDARQALKDGVPDRLHPFEALFLYLPFEHSENLADQNESVRLFTELQNRLPSEIQSFGQDVLNYALKHRVVIERFGRFPHRNAALGRPSTAEEIEFLKTPGSGF